VVGVAHFAHRKAHSTYEHLRPIFTLTDREYKDLLEKWFRTLSSPSGVLRFSGVLFVLGLVTMLATYGSTAHLRDKYHLAELRPPSYPAEWFSVDHRWPAVLIQGLYAVGVALALGTAARMLIVNLRFSLELRKTPIIPVPTLVRARLRQVTGLYLAVSLCWTLGVLLFVLLFQGAYGPLSLTFIGILFVLGIMQLAMPQLIFRRYIYNSYDRLCRLVLKTTCSLGGGALHERIGADGKPGDDPLAASPTFLPANLADLAQLTTQPKVWVYDARDVALWLGSQTTAVAVVVLQLLTSKS